MKISFNILTKKMDKIDKKIKGTKFDNDDYYPSMEDIEELLIPNLDDAAYFDYLVYLEQKSVPGYEEERAKIRELLNGMIF